MYRIILKGFLSGAKRMLGAGLCLFPNALRPNYLIKAVLEEMPMEDVVGYEKYWEKRREGSNRAAQIRAVLLESVIEPGETLCDIGCGDGEFLKVFKERGVQVEGIETSMAAIKACQEKNIPVRAIDLVEEDENIPKGYDYISAMCLLEHVQDPEIIVKKVRDKFRKKLIIAIPNVGYLPHRIRLLFGRFPVVNIFYHVREHIRFWTVKDFRYWQDRMGLRMVKMIPQTKGRMAKIWPGLFSSNIIYIMVRK